MIRPDARHKRPHCTLIRSTRPERMKPVDSCVSIPCVWYQHTYVIFYDINTPHRLVLHALRYDAISSTEYVVVVNVSDDEMITMILMSFLT